MLRKKHKTLTEQNLRLCDLIKRKERGWFSNQTAGGKTTHQFGKPTGGWDRRASTSKKEGEAHGETRSSSRMDTMSSFTGHILSTTVEDRELPCSVHEDLFAVSKCALSTYSRSAL
ncbi:uncharacterized protein LOC143656862 [Tamandua tetradactyla]|uniref:uncharacterized protein LOC143656862 n=1 Tax=Tamandua tetradactyla TaxID=48850 RepID=UPI004054138E